MIQHAALLSYYLSPPLPRWRPFEVGGRNEIIQEREPCLQTECYWRNTVRRGRDIVLQQTVFFVVV